LQQHAHILINLLSKAAVSPVVVAMVKLLVAGQSDARTAGPAPRRRAARGCSVLVGLGQFDPY
jgi:hypothetical protein